MHLCPDGQFAQDVPITVTVWPATLPTRWPVSIEAGSDARITGSIAAGTFQAMGRAYHMTVIPDQPAPKRQGWYRITEPGGLSNGAGLLAIRLIPWDAWARHAPGISIPLLCHWPWLSLPKSIADGQIYLARLPANYGMIGDLVYPCAETPGTLQPSIRLEMLRDGLEDVACLQQLADALAQHAVPVAEQRAVQDVLEQARKLAKMPTAPGASGRFSQLRQRIAELLSRLTGHRIQR